MALIKLNSRAIPDDTVIASDIADGSISTAKLAADAVTNAKLAADAVTTPKIADSVNLGRRNLVINGDMTIAQRGTSFTSATTAYHVDRFLDVMNLGAWTVSQSTDSPDGFSNSWKWDCTTANGTLASSSELIFVTRLEGQDLQHLKYGTSAAESLTLSFWVKSSKTGTYTCEFDQYGDRQISRTYTINSANTWEKKTLTVPGDVGGSIDNDNSAEFQLLWWLGAGSNLTSGTLNTSAWAGVTNANRVSSSQVNLADNTANDWYITGVQLELGDTATPFEHRSFGEELRLCSRYYRYVGRYMGGGREGYSASAVTFYPGLRLTGNDVVNIVTTLSAGGVKYSRGSVNDSNGTLNGTVGITTHSNDQAFTVSFNHNGTSTGSTYNGTVSGIYVDGLTFDAEL
jgi:hypothetical protein